MSSCSAECRFGILANYWIIDKFRQCVQTALLSTTRQRIKQGRADFSE